jgi:DNA-binding transcriptional MerR regulator
MPELPSKLFFRIGEVASLVGVEPHVLRYWEREFRSIRPTKSAKGQRVYSRKDVENLLRVRDLLYRDGFTIAGAKKRLQRGPEAEAEAATNGEGAAERLADTDGETDGAAAALASALLTPGAIDAGNGRGAAHDGVRHKLSALRAEVETFLAELTPERRR